MDNIETSGSCLCRGVRYSLTKKPKWCGHCHCKDCRRQSGSCFSTFAVFDMKSLKITEGDLKKFSSSPGITRYFCGDCGTPVGYHSMKKSDEIHINIGTLDQPEKYAPQFHVYCLEKLPWLEISDDLPRFELVP